MSRYREKRPWQHLYGRKRWAALRERQLTEQPLCEYCLKREVIEPATIVDHIKPHKGDVDMFHDPENLQSLCKHCHDSVKQREEAGETVVQFDSTGWPVEN